ncbi:thiol reductant ABC exporter subunit CydC [Solicola sp. PLA-1-18]|uniref:thiol reductant ABC exporter subunit CydC n=1 Tax=Solicola sp. PLA-1-18 TaxID=3380532 RepID=UPI003B8131AE
MLRPDRRTRGRLLLGWFVGVLAAWSTAGLLLVSAWLISRAAEQPPVLYLMVAIVGVRACGIARAVLRYGERLVTHDAALRLLTDVRVRAYDGVRRRGPSGRRHGDLVRRVTADADAAQDRLLRVALPVAVTTTVAVGVTALVLAVLPAGGLLLAACVAAAGIGVPALVALASRRAQRTVAPLGGELASLGAEAVRAAPELAAHDARDVVLVPLRRTASELRRAARGSAWLDGLGAALVRVVLGVAVCGLVWLGTAAVADGSMRPVVLAVVVLAPLVLAELLEALPATAQDEIRTRAGVDRLRELTEPGGSSGLGDGVTGASPSGTDLRVRGLRAGWADGPYVIDGLDLDVPAGAVVAVVGPSGCGKSTLAHVLLGLLAARAGSVELGGVAYDDLGGDVVRAHVGLLGQDEHVFDTTVRENLRVARPDVDDDGLWSALAQAGLADFVRGLPKGLDTPVGEHGGRLSGGERQRLGLARMLLADRSVLVVDEPTEHLDEAAGEALVRDLVALAPSRSLVVVTHQRGWLDHADLVLDLAVPRSATSEGPVRRF